MIISMVGIKNVVDHSRYTHTAPRKKECIIDIIGGCVCRRVIGNEMGCSFNFT